MGDKGIHDRLFRAIVILGASLGSSACGGKDCCKVDAAVDGHHVDAAPKDGPPSDVPVDVVAIL